MLAILLRSNFFSNASYIFVVILRFVVFLGGELIGVASRVRQAC